MERCAVEIIFQRTKIELFNYISSRIIKLKNLLKGKEMEIIQKYGPQTGCQDEEDDALIGELEKVGNIQQ